MKKIKSLWTRVSAPHYTYYVDLIVAVTMLAMGIYELFPSNQLPANNLYGGVSQESIERSLALVQITASVMLGYSFFAKDALIGRIGSFIAFFIFTFYTFMGIATNVNALYWIASGALALICGAMHIRLGWDD